MQRYVVIREYTTEDLVARVQALIDQGWKCQGGVSVGDYNTYVQAMVIG